MGCNLSWELAKTYPIPRFAAGSLLYIAVTDACPGAVWAIRSGHPIFWGVPVSITASSLHFMFYPFGKLQWRSSCRCHSRLIPVPVGASATGELHWRGVLPWSQSKLGTKYDKFECKIAKTPRNVFCSGIKKAFDSCFNILFWRALPFWGDIKWSSLHVTWFYYPTREIFCKVFPSTSCKISRCTRRLPAMAIWVL